jgi:hypothetical protein
MVAKDLDDPAIGDPPARALHDHALLFRLQRGKAHQATFHLGQLRLGDGVGGSAALVGMVRQAEQVADCLEREAKIAGMPDEGQPLRRLAALKPLVAGTALSLGQESDLFVIADGRHLHPGRLPEFSDGQHQISLETIVARDIRDLSR